MNDTTKTTIVIKGRVQCYLEIKTLEADLLRVRATKDDAQPAWCEAETRLAQGVEAIKRIAESLHENGGVDEAGGGQGTGNLERRIEYWRKQAATMLEESQRCANCWRRTAALKRLAKQHPEDSPEYEAGLMEIYATDYTTPGAATAAPNLTNL